MGRIIQQNNGKTTVYVTGENINNLPVSADTYYIGVDIDGNYKLLNPSGDTSDFTSGGFTGGTISGDTVIIGGLSATTFSATTYLNLPVSTFTGGTVSGDTVFVGDLSATVFSAETYLNLPCCADVPVTYNEFLDKITGGTLTVGTYYLITDFKTCYDQPDYDSVGNPITIGNYKEGPVEPILVLATSPGEISTTAYQPLYPNDRIQYDWTWDMTEVTDGIAYGRITERIDEFNNRTDYDHRTVLFKRYDNYYYKENNIAEGTIELIENTGEVIGTDTEFSNYNIGDYIAIPNSSEIFFEIVSISADTSMVVSGLTIPAVSAGSSFYPAQKDGLTYKQNNISIDYTEHPTFLFENETIISNYIGDVAIFRDWSGHYFLLPNNVFGEDVIGNRIGNNFINNTFSRDVEHNVIGDYFENNTIYNDSDFANNKIANNFRNHLIICDGFYSNVIGDGINNNKFFNNNNIVYNQIGVRFNDNTIYSDFGDNKIGNDFYSNVIDGSFTHNSIGNQFNNNDTYQNFNDNSIGHDFNNNTIYSSFYKNEILNNFNDNIIGDSGNLDNFEFYRNRIGNDFYENTIRQDFQNNQIGNQYNNNVVNGDFYKNVIGNGFNNNPNIGYNFYGNNIGNGFNENELIGDYFKENKIGENFESNSISYLFNNNQIGNTFENNTLGDTQFFNWDNTNIENLTGRTYNTFYNSLYGDGGNNVGNVILGKELIMRFLRNSGSTITSGDLVIDETYEITNYQGSDDFSNVADVISGVINTNGCIFIATGTTPTEWSSNSELTELTSYDEYHKVKFTQWTQNNNGGGFSYERTKVYPTSEPTVYFTKTNYETVVDIIIPGRLEIKRGNGGAIYNDVLENSWDENVSPEETGWNSIYTQPFNGSEFGYNTIFGDFKGNYIRGDFAGNKIDSDVGGNEFSGNTYLNNIGILTYDNDFLGDVYGNNWVGPFYLNVIGDSFESNSFGHETYNNTIGTNFNANSFGENTYNNTIGEDFFSNNIKENFYENTIGNGFQYNQINQAFIYNDIAEYFTNNIIDTDITTVDFTSFVGNISGLTYSATGDTATDGSYIVSGTTNGDGVNATFTVTVSLSAVTDVVVATVGKYYLNSDTVTILGSQIDGTDGVDDIIVTITSVSILPNVYEGYTCQIFENSNGTKRLSYYDESDVLTITDVNK